MIIEPDVRAAARAFGLTERFVRFAQAVVEAEGGGDHIIRAVQLSIPSIQTRKDALDVLCRSIVHRLCDYRVVTDERLTAFAGYFGSFWAPIGADNDPTSLNANWTPNVVKLLASDNA